MTGRRSGLRAQGSGLRAQGLGLRAQGSGLRAQGLRLVVAFILATLASPAPEGLLRAQDQSATPRVPSRIISLVPAITEMLFAIGAGDRVIGVSSFDTFPPEVATRARVGALLDPDFERILSLRPDLVVVYGTQTELIDRLNRVSIPTFVYQHARLSDITAMVGRIGDRVGRSADAARLAKSIEQDLAAVRAASAGRPRPRVMLVIEREPGALRNIFASGGFGFLHDLLELAGATNVFADVLRENVQVSAELLLARAPDVVIETHPSNWPGNRAREQAAWRAMAALPAVRANRIHLVADDRLFIPGPRVAEGAKVLAEIIGTR
jgi:iron complex transport system substrate-binding protein